MRKRQWHMVPEYGLSLEDTLAAGDRTGVESLARYWWARDVAEQLGAKHLWDLGCGCGYGTRIMAERPGLNTVIGFDGDREAVNQANATYGAAEGIGFVEYFLDMPWEIQALSGPVEMVAAFEIFEVLKHREIFLEQVVSKLSKEGVFLLTAGHANRLRVSYNPNDAMIHYDRVHLAAFLRRYFGYISFSNEPKPEFAFVHKVNEYIAAHGRDPYEIGKELVYCASPRA